MKRLGYPKPEEEYRFHPKRKFRADRAYPQRMILIEVEGGIYTRGRHTRPKGYTRDCEKYSWASIMGYVVIRLTAPMLRVTELGEECLAAQLMAAAWKNTNP